MLEATGSWLTRFALVTLHTAHVLDQCAVAEPLLASFSQSCIPMILDGIFCAARDFFGDISPPASEQELDACCLLCGHETAHCRAALLLAASSLIRGCLTNLPIAKLLVHPDELLLFCQSPCILFYVRAELVVPALPALLTNPTWELCGNSAPLALP